MRRRNAARHYVAVVACLFALGCGSSEDANNNANNTNNVNNVNNSNNVNNANNSNNVNNVNNSNNVNNVEPLCDVAFAPDGEPFDTLAEYCFFGGHMAEHIPNAGVVPYDVIATLYADDSKKLRYLVLPEGEQIGYTDTEKWSFPLGTVIIKTFYVDHDERDPALGRRIMETRLLVNESDGWQPYIYVWNEEQTEAKLRQIGQWIDLEWVGMEGQTRTLEYRVPNKNQCKNCHGQDDFFEPLGPNTRQMNRTYAYDGEDKNQLEHLAELGLFDQEIPDTSTLFTLSDPLGNDDVERRARSYLDANCAHCHNGSGAAGPTGLQLSVFIDEPREYGICRRPVAAGSGSGDLLFDIKPGHSDESIIVFRMASTDPELKMPELPTQTADLFGVDLISAWIDSMDPSECEGL